MASASTTTEIRSLVISSLEKILTGVTAPVVAVESEAKNEIVAVASNGEKLVKCTAKGEGICNPYPKSTHTEASTTKPALIRRIPPTATPATITAIDAGDDDRITIEEWKAVLNFL